jgi:hypothetical protein
MHRRYSTQPFVLAMTPARFRRAICLAVVAGLTAVRVPVGLAQTISIPFPAPSQPGPTPPPPPPPSQPGPSQPAPSQPGPSQPAPSQPVPVPLQPSPTVPGPSSKSSGPVQVAVTGAPAPVDTVRLGIETAVREIMPAARDAEVTVVSAVPALAPLDPSTNAAVQATVQVTSPARHPQLMTLPVAVTNVAARWPDAQVLFVSNSPETLPFGKVLYNAALLGGQTARLLYHHQNGSKIARMTIEVALSNPTRSPITLWVNGASGGPAADELLIGHAAAFRFLEQYATHAAFLMQIPANTTVPLLLHDLPPLGVVSGIVQLGLVTGDRLNLQVFARLAGEMDPPTESFMSDFDNVHQRGAFANPQLTRSVTFVAGGPPVIMTLGDDADLLREGATGTQLQGNYGVVYNFDVHATNPTSDPVVASLVMHADGGQARGTFIVDNQLINGPTVQPNAPKTITTIKLMPGADRTFRITTMPESGSNYPVHLLLGPPP